MIMFSNMHPYTCLNSIAASRKALIIEECSVLMSLTKCGVHLADFLKIGLEFVLVSLQVRFQIMISVSSEGPAKPPTLT